MSLNIKYKTKEECLNAVKQDGLNIRFCDLELRKDEDIAKTAVRNDGLALLYVPYEYALHYDLAMDAVKSNGLAYFCLPQTLREDTSIAVAAVSEYAYIYPYVDCRQVKCEAFEIEAIKRDPNLVSKYFPYNDTSKDQYIVAQEYNNETYAIIARVMDKEVSSQVFATFWKNGEPYGIDYYDNLKEAKKYMDREMRKLKEMERERMYEIGGIDTTITRRSYDFFTKDAERDAHPENKKKYQVEDALEAKQIKEARERYRVENAMDNIYNNVFLGDDER